MMKKHRSPSQLWETALNKIFPRRTSQSRQDEHNLFASFNSAAATENTDGLCVYAQALLEKENRKLGTSTLRKSDSTDASFSSALMAPIERPVLPYTVSSPGWNIYSENIKALDHIIDEDASNCLHSVLSVFAKVYTVSKILTTILSHYGIEVEDMPDSMPAHIKRAEELVTSDSTTALIEIVESLYYSSYARLIMEMANVDLCTYFNLELRRHSNNAGFTLPEPSHLLKIYAYCKEVLDTPVICHNVNVDLVRAHQNMFINRAMDKAIGAEFFLNDLLGYRRYIMGVAGDLSSEFRSKWNNTPLYQIPPEEIMAVQSEKYLSFVPRPGVSHTLNVAGLPFVNPEEVDPDVWEREIIQGHRQATLAKLEGKSVGDIRRTDDRRRASEYMKERRCICRSSCICSTDCTSDSERHCPCSERLLSILLVKRRKTPESHDFGARCSSLAKLVFEGASYLKRDIDDIEVAFELERAFLLINNEILKQRQIAARANGIITE